MFYDTYTLASHLFSMLICFLYVLSAALVRRRMGRGRSVRSMTRLQYMHWQRSFSRSPLDKLLEQAGRPFRLTAWRWHVLRYVIAGLWLFGSAYGGNYPDTGMDWLLRAAGAVSWLLITNGKASPATYLLRKWKEVCDGEKNRELFMVYSLIADELQGGGRRQNLYSLLAKLKEYTRLIKPAMNAGLRVFDEGPYAALTETAERIGTKEAKELCKLLADLDTTPPEELETIIGAREESYTHMLRENRRRRRKLFGSLAYAAAFAPLLIYLWNTLNIAQHYVVDLANSTNQLQ